MSGPCCVSAAGGHVLPRLHDQQPTVPVSITSPSRLLLVRTLQACSRLAPEHLTLAIAAVFIRHRLTGCGRWSGGEPEAERTSSQTEDWGTRRDGRTRVCVGVCVFVCFYVWACVCVCVCARAPPEKGGCRSSGWRHELSMKVKTTVRPRWRFPSAEISPRSWTDSNDYSPVRSFLTWLGSARSPARIALRDGRWGGAGARG